MQLSCYEKIAEHFFLILLTRNLLALPSMVALPLARPCPPEAGKREGLVLCTRVHHYDEHGRKTGTSRPGLFGGYINYDAKGNKVGRSELSLFGGYNHYDNHGKKTGHSDPSAFGGYKHYDSKNNPNGSSSPNFVGGYNHSSDG